MLVGEVNATYKSLDKELNYTSRCLGRLGALFCDLEDIRDTLEYENDLNYFDKTVDPAKEKVLIEVSKLKGFFLLFSNITYTCPKTKQVKDVDDNEGESWNILEEEIDDLEKLIHQGSKIEYHRKKESHIIILILCMYVFSRK
jgi:hypothetical protein